MLIVVIEEDSAMRALISEWLASEGYSVQGSSAAGIGPVPGQGDAELVIVDVQNLRSQGMDELRRVRVNYPRAALIGLSTQLGRSIPGRSLLAGSLGVSWLVSKPLEREELMKAVAETVGAPH